MNTHCPFFPLSPFRLSCPTRGACWVDGVGASGGNSQSCLSLLQILIGFRCEGCFCGTVVYAVVFPSNRLHYHSGYTQATSPWTIHGSSTSGSYQWSRPRDLPEYKFPKKRRRRRKPVRLPLRQDEEEKGRCRGIISGGYLSKYPPVFLNEYMYLNSNSTFNTLRNAEIDRHVLEHFSDLFFFHPASLRHLRKAVQMCEFHGTWTFHTNGSVRWQRASIRMNSRQSARQVSWIYHGKSTDFDGTCVAIFPPYNSWSMARTDYPCRYVREYRRASMQGSYSSFEGSLKPQFTTTPGPSRLYRLNSILTAVIPGGTTPIRKKECWMASITYGSRRLFFKRPTWSFIVPSRNNLWIDIRECSYIFVSHTGG